MDLAPSDVELTLSHVARTLLPAGSEAIGRVTGVGSAASEWLGKRVVVPRALPCGECDACRRLAIGRCPALVLSTGEAARRVVPARFLLEPLDAETREPSSLLALIDALATPYAAIARAGVQAGDAVHLLGSGPRRTGAALLLEHLAAKLLDDVTGAAHVIATEPAHFAAALAAAAPGRTLILLDGPSRPTLSFPETNGHDLAMFVQGPAHPDLLPELDALVASGALDLSTLELPVVTLPAP